MFWICLLLWFCIPLYLGIQIGHRQPPTGAGWIKNSFFIGLKPGSLWEKVVKISKECNENGGVLQYLPFFYVITDPDALTVVLNSSLEKGVFFRFWHRWLGGGLVTASVPTWKQHRKLLCQVFSQRQLEGHLDTFNVHARAFAQRWAAAGDRTFDAFKDLATFNLDINCLALLGFSEEKQILYEYGQAVHELNSLIRYRFERFWLFSDYIYMWTPTARRELECLEVLHGLSNKMIEKRKAELVHIKKYTDVSSRTEAKESQRFIDYLLELESRHEYTKDEVRAEVDTFLFAGHDSAAVTIFHALLLLGSYPEVQEKAYQEIQAVLGTSQHIQKDHLPELVYLDAVIKESMRLYPFAPFTQRYVDKTITVKNYRIPAGSTVFVIFYGAHRHPVWTDANRFWPERWLQSHTLPNSPAAFAPFSWGKRACIAKSYAAMLVKTTLAHLLRNFRFTADHSKLKFELDVVLKAVSGHQMSLEKRL